MQIKVSLNQLSAKEAFGPNARYNPFQREIETRPFN